MRKVSAQLHAEGVRNPEINSVNREVWADVVARLSDVIRHGQEIGDLDQGLDPEGLALLLAAIHTGLTMHLANEPELDTEPSISALQALFNGRFLARQLQY
jgi:hypothetical protein